MKISKIITSAIFSCWLISLISIQSCTEEDGTIPATRIIRNETQDDALIEVYGFGELVESLTIPSGGADTVKSICDISRGRVVRCDIIWGFGDQNDSVRVIFDSRAFITYCSKEENCSVNDKNIMFFNAEGTVQEGGYVEVVDQVFAFTLTQDDLDVAIPLGN